MSTQTDVSITVQTYVAYVLPGAMVGEETIQEVDWRDLVRDAVEAPVRAYAMSYYDIVSATVEIDGESVELQSRRRNASKLYYIDGTVLDEQAVAALPGDSEYHLNTLNLSTSKLLVVTPRLINSRPFYPDREDVVSTTKPVYTCGDTSPQS